jgi:polysaccharide biosynthesis protein PslF
VFSVRPLFVSTFPPEECELAGVTRDTVDAVDWAAPEPVSFLAVIQKTHPLPVDDPRVVHIIHNAVTGAYARAAAMANGGPFDVVSLQHTFGLFPGDWGEQVLEFVRACRKPIVTTFHTLMPDPAPRPRQLIRELAARSQGIVVTTKTAAALLQTTYLVNTIPLRVIPPAQPAKELASGMALENKLDLAAREAQAIARLVAWQNVGRQYLEFFWKSAVTVAKRKPTLHFETAPRHSVEVQAN